MDNPKKTKYYYKTVIIKPEKRLSGKIPAEKIENELNRLGQLGWEVVSNYHNQYGTEHFFLLKNTESNL